MTIKVEIPEIGESITEAVIVKWHKADGDYVAIDQPLCELETDKATVDLPAPAAGVLHARVQAGQTVKVGQTVAEIDESAAAAEPARAEATPSTEASTEDVAPQQFPEPPATHFVKEPPPPAPAEAEPPSNEPAKSPAETSSPAGKAPAADVTPKVKEPSDDSDEFQRVPMSKIRRRIAERLVRAQQSAAMLTTYNEIDMTGVQELRARYKQRFEEVHGVSLGLMSFFARACVIALKQCPVLNAEIDGSDILYYKPIHLGIAVSTERGLVVPVLKNVEAMSFARIEQEIKRVAAAARSGKLALDELSGGTFTITNGGVFGSLLSMPILNPPQTGILGMHAIQKRPAVVDDQIVARPLMYVALTYDHRLVDGQDSVSFLVRVKQLLENPAEMLLEL